MLQEEKVIKARSKQLTNAQRHILKSLKKMPGSFIVAHTKITGTPVYRLMSASRSPITNFSQRPVEKLVSISRLIKSEGIIKLSTK